MSKRNQGVAILMLVAALLISFSLGAQYGLSSHPATVTLTCKPVSVSYPAPNLPPIIQTVCEVR